MRKLPALGLFAAAIIAASPAPAAPRTETGPKTAQLPFRLLNNHIYAEVTVNDTGPYLFIFDTGGVNIITPALARTLGLKAKAVTRAIGAGPGHMTAGFTRIASLGLGALRVANLRFAVVPLDRLSHVEGIAETGAVGFSTFRRFVTRIDYGTHRITFMAPDAFDPKHAGTAVPIRISGTTIEARAIYDGIAGDFIVDTGSRASLILNAPFVKAHGLRAKAGKGVNAIIGWGVGGPARAFVSRGDVLRFGGYAIHGPVVAMSTDKAGGFAAATPSGDIGTGILKRFIVTFDYAHALMYLKPVTTPVSDLDNYDRAGMWINAARDGFKVVAVTKGAPADQAGIEAGDIIMSVDGRTATQIKLHDLRRRLRNDAAGTEIRFTLRRGGKTRAVKVTLRELI